MSVTLIDALKMFELRGIERVVGLCDGNIFKCISEAERTFSQGTPISDFTFQGHTLNCTDTYNIIKFNDKSIIVDNQGEGFLLPVCSNHNTVEQMLTDFIIWSSQAANAVLKQGKEALNFAFSEDLKAKNSWTNTVKGIGISRCREY